MTPGQIAEFNMWSHEIDEIDINPTSCGTFGDVVSWNTLEEYGEVTTPTRYRVFPDCPGNIITLMLYLCIFIHVICIVVCTRSSIPYCNFAFQIEVFLCFTCIILKILVC